MRAYTQISTRQTPQTEPIPGREAEMVQNNAGGYGFALGPLAYFERFLILGSEGGSYYVSEQKLTKENAANIFKVMQTDGLAAIDRIVQISASGRAPKNDPAIFSLAIAAAAPDPRVRAYALAQLPKVCRIPSHLFHFLTFVKQFRGFGRGLKRAVGNWYQEHDNLGYTVAKYQSRDGWSNADALRLSHPRTTDTVRNAVYKWIVDGEMGEHTPSIIRAMESAKTASCTTELLHLIRDHGLSREMLPTEALTKPEVWEALLPTMGTTALVRNLATMTKVGLLKPLSQAVRLVCDRLRDRERLKKDRIHPIQILLALKTYQQGHGMRGSGAWSPVGSIIEALDDAFYASFDFMVPTGKRLIVGVDVSSSMSAGINNLPMSAREGAAAMALACVKTERDYEVVLFNTGIVDTPKLTSRMSLAKVERVVSRHGGGTDCAQPLLWATDNKIQADAFLILTDNETWAGKRHSSQVITSYRQQINPNAMVINVGMTATQHTTNDPLDLKALDVVGFDASVPAVVSDFIRGAGAAS